jgi:hypothetical protein
MVEVRGIEEASKVDDVKTADLGLGVKKCQRL